eukprot:TRINITY_DN3660_c0_g2_i1.p1 TRINITY_DN3660_c0_g2~~TRINITY_DN3660_c0_g2_i1.p1  ORF type:complete len:417 (+),score=102.21 TRINITY_DN3660_c0_g2_i1:54-1304(+)
MAGVSARCRGTADPCVVLMKRLIAQHAGRWAEKGGVASLAQGIVHWEPPPGAYAAAAKALTEGGAQLHRYTPDEGTDDLVAALRRKLAAENGLPGAHVMVTAGANQAFMNCVLTFVGEGDKTIVFRPYYFNHVMAVQCTRGDDALVIGPCTEHGVPDLAWLAAQLSLPGHGVTMVTVVNPGNPTGVALPRSVLEKAAGICRAHGVWLVMDVTYEHFDHARANSNPGAGDGGGDGVPFWCSPADHVVHVFSFSKGYALAGFRVGYTAMAPGPRGDAAFQEMLKVQDTIPICPSHIGQIAAAAALAAGRGWVDDKVAGLAGNRDAVLAALAPLPRTMGGTGAMYVMAELPPHLPMDDVAAAELLVRDHGVATIPGSFCGLPGWLRVCYANLPPAACRRAAQRLRTGVEALCNLAPARL